MAELTAEEIAHVLANPDLYPVMTCHCGKPASHAARDFEDYYCDEHKTGDAAQIGSPEYQAADREYRSKLLGRPVG